MVSSSSPSSPRTTSADAAAAREHLGEHRREPRVGAPDQARRAAGPGWSAGRARSSRSGTPSSRRGPDGVPHRRVEHRREAEPDADLARRRRPRASGGRSMATPSASSTSAAPLADDAARLPCLTTGTPAAATTTAAIVEMFTVCAWSPPVPTTSTARPGHRHPPGVPQHRLGQPGDLRRGLALGPQRDEEPGELGGGRLARRAPGPSPRRCRRAPRSVPASRRPSRPGQVCRGGRRHAGRPQPRVGQRRAGWARRSTSATVSAAVSGSSGCTSTASACDQVASQRSSLPAHGDDDRRAVVDLVLQLPGQAHPPGRLGLAVEDREVDVARVRRGEHLGDARRPRRTAPGRRPARDAGRRP